MKEPEFETWSLSPLSVVSLHCSYIYLFIKDLMDAVFVPGTESG